MRWEWLTCTTCSSAKNGNKKTVRKDRAWVPDFKTIVGKKIENVTLEDLQMINLTELACCCKCAGEMEGKNGMHFHNILASEKLVANLKSGLERQAALARERAEAGARRAEAVAKKAARKAEMRKKDQIVVENNKHGQADCFTTRKLSSLLKEPVKIKTADKNGDPLQGIAYENQVRKVTRQFMVSKKIKKKNNDNDKLARKERLSKRACTSGGSNRIHTLENVVPA